jgi:hypothetical protein
MFHFILLTLLYVANTTESTDTEQIRRINEAERIDEAEQIIEAEPEQIEESKKHVNYCNKLPYPPLRWIPEDFQKYFHADATITLCGKGDYHGPAENLQRCSDGDVHVVPYDQCVLIDVSGANWTETALIPPGTASWNHTFEWRYCADDNNQLRNVFADGDTVNLPLPPFSWSGSLFCDRRQGTSSTITPTTSIIPSLTTTTTTSTIEHGHFPVVPVSLGGGLVALCCIGLCHRQITRAWRGCQERLQRNRSLRQELQQPNLEAGQNHD